MSTSSEKPAPTGSEDSIELVSQTTWGDLSAQLTIDTQAELSLWLESELDALEKELSRFASSGSQLSGRLN